jgi:hypothetical protein
MDLNNNGTDDSGEPVTFPSTNQLTVSAGQQANKVLSFDYVK